MVVNHQRRVRVAVKPLEVFVERVRQALGLPEHALTVCLVSEATIARMNQTFRGKRGPTDVLSFRANGRLLAPGGREAAKQGGRTAETRRAQRTQRTQRNANAVKGFSSASFASSVSSDSYLGDVAISPETARRNARRYARTLPEELRILILHGALHLAGYDHETDDGEMDRLERRLRRRLGLS